MTDLRELYPVPKTVPFGSGTVEVRGLSLRKISALVHEYHDLIGIFSGGRTGLGNLLAQAPDAALAIFAFSVDDEEKVKAFDDLAFGQQADILGAIYELTLGGERAGPFVASLASQLRVTENPTESSTLSSSSPSSTISSEVADTEATLATSRPDKPAPDTTLLSDVSSAISG